MEQDQQRRDRLSQALRTAGLDAVVCATASEVRLLTGFWPIMANSVAVFTAEGKAHLIVPDDEQQLAETMSAAPVTTFQPETLHQLPETAQALRSAFAGLFGDLGLQHARLGLVTKLGLQPATYIVGTDFRLALWDLVQQVAPAAHMTSCDEVLEQQKAVKTRRELDLMATAARVAAAGFRAAPEAIQPGLREAEVAATIQQAFDAAPEAASLERSYGAFFCMSGPNSATAAAAYARTRQRRLEIGDIVMIHANTCADGLWTDITRTYTVGASVERHEQMRSAIAAARSAALGAIRPGVPCREVDQAARNVMQDHGFGEAFKHATGHGVGFAAANANALPRIHPASPGVLEAGMTFNVEPAAYFDGYGGMRHCDVVAVTDDGAQVFTDF